MAQYLLRLCRRNAAYFQTGIEGAPSLGSAVLQRLATRSYSLFSSTKPTFQANYEKINGLIPKLGGMELSHAATIANLPAVRSPIRTKM
jgi:hypothetical protein